jgi:hypothetical protein
VNKPINLHYFYSCIHIFIFSVFLIFLVFLGAGSSSAHMGWAGPSQPGPARSLAQASDPAGQDAHNVKVIKLPSHCVQCFIEHGE